jgi:hypothetical protein
MSALFLVAFVLGLVLGVLSMLLGVERRPPGAGAAIGIPFAALTSSDALLAATRQISARYAIPLLASFSTGFGATGYVVHRMSGAGTVLLLAVALIGGGLWLLLAVVLIAGWAVPSARRDVPDGRYLLQGHFALVTAPITDAESGKVAVQVDGVQHLLTARSLDGTPIDSGTEVVIERVEIDVAFVEPWAQVERRL